MGFVQIALTILGLWCGLVATSVRASDTSPFATWYEEGKTGQLALSWAVENHLQDFRFVLVAGFLNEVFPGAFSENVSELTRLGVPKERIYTLYPSSSETYLSNSHWLRQQLENIEEKGSGRIVLIAHSRGAVDVLADAIQNEAWTKRNVAAIFLFNGPFGGSPLANYMEGDAPIAGPSMPKKARDLAYLYGSASQLLIKPYAESGLREMTLERSNSFWKRLLAEFPQAPSELGPFIYYVKARFVPDGTDPFMYATGTYLSTYYGDNDGIVLTKDQFLPEIGSVLAVLDCNHNDLVSSSSYGSSTNIRAGITDAIAMQLEYVR